MATPRAVFRYGGKTYRVSSLKLREVEQIEEILGAPYTEFRPFGIMRHKLAHMAVFLGRDFPPEEVERIIGDLDLEAVRDMWDIVEDEDLPEVYENGVPLSEGGPSTASS
jgi:hypothetical protein